MKINNFTTGLLAALLVASPLAIAEPQYPEGFEPKVIYRDADLISKHGQTTTPPASQEQSSAKAQSKYPESFEPQVLYRNTDLITQNNKAVAPKATAETPRKTTSPNTTTNNTTTAEKSMTDNLPIIFIILGLAAFIVWNMKRTKTGPGAEPQVAQTSEAAVAVSNETGVSRYLRNLPEPPVETGVAKYLKSIPVVVPAETGVAKYLKSIPAPAPAEIAAVAEPGPAKETGVAKYLKNMAK